MNQVLFKGFSTKDDPTSNTNWRLTDVELVKRDILNHFYTLKGERQMLPNFGCIIWDYLMEPLTDSVREIIVDEAKRIVSLDTRVRLDSVEVLEVSNGLIINMVLYYIPWQVYEQFTMNFNSKVRGE